MAACAKRNVHNVENTQNAIHKYECMAFHKRSGSHFAVLHFHRYFRIVAYHYFVSVCCTMYVWYVDVECAWTEWICGEWVNDVENNCCCWLLRLLLARPPIERQQAHGHVTKSDGMSSEFVSHVHANIMAAIARRSHNIYCVAIWNHDEQGTSHAVLVVVKHTHTHTHTCV